MKKIAAITAAFMLITVCAFTEEAVEPSAPEPKKVEYSTKLSLAIAFHPAAMINVTESFKVPVMQFDNPLTKDNNITFKLGAGLSPVTLDASFSMAWTPIAFLELYTGGLIGSGWSIKNLHGVAINKIDNKKTPLNFSRAFYAVHFGGALQFDLGAVVPHDWTHIIFRIDQFGSYKGLTHTDKYTSWVWQNDVGENRNGLRYEASYVLGYKMPIYLNLIGMMVNTEKTYFAVKKGVNKSKWGEDRLYVKFGPILNFEIMKGMNLLLIAEWETKHPYTSGENSFYQNRTIDKSKPEKVAFKRAALLFSYTIKHW